MTTNKIETSNQTQISNHAEILYQSNRDITPNTSFSEQSPVPGQYSRLTESPVTTELVELSIFRPAIPKHQLSLFT